MEHSSERTEIGSKSYEIRGLVYNSTISKEEKLEDEFFEFINKKQGAQHTTLSVRNGEGTMIAGIYATFYFNKSDSVSVFLSGFFVSEGFRRKGLGTSMLKKFEDFVKADGAAKLLVCTFNFQAEKFYVKHGYREIFVVNDYVPSIELSMLSRVDLIFMSKTLDINKSQNSDERNMLKNKDGDEYEFRYEHGYNVEVLTWIRRGLDKYGQDFIGVRQKNERSITFSIKNDTNQFIAGIHASTYKGNLSISKLWISNKYKDCGIENELLKKIEEFCQENNLKKIYIFNGVPSNDFIKELEERNYGVIYMNNDYQCLLKEVVMSRLKEH